MSRIVIYKIEYEGILYEIPFTFKSQRNIYLRQRSDGSYTGSAPTLTSSKRVEDFIRKALPSLIKRAKKVTPKESPIGEGYIYLLGEKTPLSLSEKELKKYALEYLTNLTREEEKRMNISHPYKVSVRKMKTRFGSNSSNTHTIHYQLDLIHFSREIIKSVVDHELVHDEYRNHGKYFYKKLLNYCPNYWELRGKLRKGIYK